MMNSAPRHDIDALPFNIYGDDQRITRIFYWFTAAIGASLVAGILIVLTAQDTLYAIILAVSLLPIPIVLFLVRQKQFEGATVTLALLFLAMITLLATTGLGIHSLAGLGYPAILIAASMVTRKRTMVFLTLCAVGCVAWLVFGELSGAYTPEVLERSLPGDFFSAALAIVTTAFMVRLLSETLFQNHRQLRQELVERKRVEERLTQDIALRLQVEAEREKLIVELEARNTELERFTYTVSHDLKAPLITIRGFLGLVEQDARAGNIERMQADMACIMEATDKMQRLLTELLDLSRIGRMMNPPQVVAFEAIVREALDLVRGRLEARGVAVTVAADLPVVHGDRTRLVEVIQNLVDNAVKFMGDQAAPQIEIGAHVSSTDSVPVFFVRDNGIGIEPQYHERVFSLFNKLDGQSEGTGVGLALVKRIVEVHGGRVWIESSHPGAGTTFCFTLAGPPPARPTHSSL